MYGAVSNMLQSIFFEDIERHADSCSMWLIEDDQLPADKFESETERPGCLSCSEEDNAS